MYYFDLLKLWNPRQIFFHGQIMFFQIFRDIIFPQIYQRHVIFSIMCMPLSKTIKRQMPKNFP